MKKNIFLMVINIISFFSFSILLSDTIIIDTTGAGDYTTIQEGINAATEGDTVLVYPGTYYENINYNGKNIIVASLYITTQNNSYIHSTIIDGNQNGSVVLLENGETSDAVLCGFTIQNGSGTPYGSSARGGGIFIVSSAGTISHCIFKENTAILGGAISCYYSNVYFEGVTIYNNHAFSSGGGIYLYESSIEFSNEQRCNIYTNYAGYGSDIYIINTPDIFVIVDTFTVLEPDSYFAHTYGSGNFTFDILNSKITPINQDLYVNPNGDDNNSGLTPEEPLKTIAYALTCITSDSLNPNTIYLASGTYSPSLTGEKFALNCRNYVSIIGENEETTILDGDELSNLIVIWEDNHFSIENLTIQNGNSRTGGGIKLRDDSSPIIKNVTIKDNTSSLCGGGVYCGYYSDPILENVTIENNIAQTGGGIYISYYASSYFINCKINNNSAIDPDFGGHGGIICTGRSNMILINTELVDNYAMVDISGFSDLSGTGDNPNSYLINCTVSNNSLTPRCNLLANDANLTVINCIFRNYSDDEITFSDIQAPDTLTISYTNIEGGIDAINTNNNGTVNWLEGNIDEDPMFIDTLNNNYQLLQGSPCIDAGNPDTTGLNLPQYDLAGNPRIYNGIIDMGAYEWPGYGVDEPDTSFIKKLYLFQNNPNPFSSSTKITFISADYESVKDYTLSIYNAKGQLIRTYNGRKHNFWVKTDIVWDGTDEEGNKVKTGVYFYKLEYGNSAIVRKMILLQ
ncbi:MAG: T9SS type A sorting domain-containing protein [Candidatus Cloacimonetes bacterium]|nr:T9SS type A sorting domain-containing protein [Candidatus Cloacimonadota bacterium]